MKTELLPRAEGEIYNSSYKNDRANSCYKRYLIGGYVWIIFEPICKI